MGKSKFTQKTLDSAVKDMERVCSKYGISPTYLSVLVMRKRGKFYKKAANRFNYGYLIPNEKKIRKPFSKEVEDFISKNLDRPSSEIIDMLFDKFPNLDKPRSVLFASIYYRKNREERCRIARERHSQDPTDKRKSCLEYYHNRLKTVGVYTKRQKEREQDNGRKKDRNQNRQHLRNRS